MHIFHGFYSFSKKFPHNFFYKFNKTIAHATTNTLVEYKKNSRFSRFLSLFSKKISFSTCQTFANAKMQYDRPVCTVLKTIGAAVFVIVAKTCGKCGFLVIL